MGIKIPYRDQTDVFLSNVKRASTKGRIFLRDQASSDGWSDFSTHHSGQSTEWVTAYILGRDVLTRGQTRPAREYVRARIGDRGSLGYNEMVPPDADSTAWATVAGGQGSLSLRSRTITTLETFLLRHCVDGGNNGLTTYRGSRIADYKGVSSSDMDGWCNTPAAGVTAVATLAAELCPQMGRLRSLTRAWYRKLATSEIPRGYWWTSPMYVGSTLLDVALLRKSKNASRPCDEKLVNKIRKELIEPRYDLTGSPFEHALILKSISTVRKIQDYGVNSVGEKHVKRLLETQEDDGRWRSENIMRIPYPGDREPWRSDYFTSEKGGTGGLHGDKGVFTTVTVLDALNHWMRSKVKPK